MCGIVGYVGRRPVQEILLAGLEKLEYRGYDSAGISVQGEDGLEIYAMCEIPSNVILAREFLTVFDGFSIGSNDLTQLVLGIDRDSGTVAHLFDEKNDAVLRMINDAIVTAQKAGKPIDRGGNQRFPPSAGMRTLCLLVGRNSHGARWIAARAKTWSNPSQ